MVDSDLVPLDSRFVIGRLWDPPALAAEVGVPLFKGGLTEAAERGAKADVESQAAVLRTVAARPHDGGRGTER